MGSPRVARTTPVLACALVLAAWIAACPREVLAALPSTRVEAHVDPDDGRVHGQVAVTFTNPTRAPLTRAYVWLLPNRLARPPAALNDVNHYWIYPRRFHPGSMDLVSVQAGPPGSATRLNASLIRPEVHALAGPRVLWSITFAHAISPGETVRVVMDYRAQIPTRYGALGCFQGQCTLAGGFYPMLAQLDESGWDLESPPLCTDMSVTVVLPRPGSMVIFDRVFGAFTRGAGERVTRASAHARNVAYASVVVASTLHESSRQAGQVTWRHVSREPPPPTDVAHEKILPYTKENYARFALQAAGEALDLVQAIDAHRILAPPQVVTMVEAPLRFELAASYPGMVLVSDRFYRIWPARRFRKFHQRQLVRALFAHLMARVITARGQEAPRDVSVAADLVASYLTDLFVVREYKKSEFMGDILQPVSFIPVVDQLLYAPQTMFAGAYFGGVLDDDPLRDHPERFMHERPRGKLYYEKLRDIMSPDALRQTLRAMIREGTAFRQAAESAYGSSLDWFFRQWSLPYPRVNYRLVSATSTPVARGAFESEIVVERQTADTDAPPIEPVVVQAMLEDGTSERLRWDGRGRRGVLRFRSSSPIERVIVDPDHRLVEDKLPGQKKHPLFDNRDSHRLRFVYNSFGVLLNVTDLSALLAADFTLSRVHDPVHRTRFTLFTSASTQVGLNARYIHGFGPAITPDRLLSNLSLRLGASRLKAGFFGDDARAASRLSLGLGFGASDRLFEFEPRFSRDVGVGASVSVTRHDAVPGGPAADYSVSGALGINAVRYHTLGGAHTLALELDGSAVFGDLETKSQLLAPGGATGLRGYAPAALFGRAQLLMRGEYLHVFVHDRNWNFGHYNIVRGVGGALFADVAAISPCESYDLASADSLHASAGYGLRFFYDSFGTLPQLMRVDLAVRLVDRNRECLGTMPGQYPPFMVYVSFLPPF